MIKGDFCTLCFNVNLDVQLKKLKNKKKIELKN